MKDTPPTAIEEDNPMPPTGSSTTTDTGRTGGRAHRRLLIPRGPHRIRVHDHAGAEPAVVLLHGYPDNLHLYDRVVPLLEGRRTVVFDFLGWGGSDKPADWDYSFAHLTRDLDAVITALDLRHPWLVAHDISGTPAIDWALDHEDQVSGLVLLNTYYGPAPTLRVPEVISILQSRWPLVRRAFVPLVNTDATFRRVFPWQLRRLVGDREVAAQFVPILMAQFLDHPSTRGPFLHLNRDMRASIAASSGRLPEVRGFPHPVVVAFGENDYSLNPAVGEHLARLFPRAVLRPIEDAAHFPQLNRPATVAEIILQTVDPAGGRPGGS